MNQPIKRVSLQSEIMKYISEYIKEHQLEPGDKLPSQGQFMEMMQVSRTALREAIKTLEAREIIEVKNGKGLYVGTSRQRKDIIADLIGINKEKERLLEILETRRALEEGMIEMVIRRATDQEMEELGELKKVLMDKFYAGLPQNEDDRAFHHKLYTMCHNPVMYSLMLLLEEHESTFWQFPLDMEDPFRESMPYHDTLCEAIRERNIPKAQKINRKLLDCVYDDIVKQ